MIKYYLNIPIIHNTTDHVSNINTVLPITFSNEQLHLLPLSLSQLLFFLLLQTIEPEVPYAQLLETLYEASDVCGS